jgi:outer membrane protein OmpA-like peptidoglycan-associated protein
MRRRQLLIGITICCVTACCLPVAYVGAEHRPLPEQQSAAARQQAAIARENADRASLTVLIAEKQAIWARKKSSSADHTESKREVAGRKTRKTAQGVVLTMEEVLFAPDQSEPTIAAIRKLSPLVTFLKDQPQRYIHIVGYADSTGSEAYNRALSQRRADTVRDFLVANGIPPRRITARGYGEATSVDSNTTTARRQENRRVEVVVPR